MLEWNKSNWGFVRASSRHFMENDRQPNCAVPKLHQLVWPPLFFGKFDRPLHNGSAELRGDLKFSQITEDFLYFRNHSVAAKTLTSSDKIHAIASDRVDESRRRMHFSLRSINIYNKNGFYDRRFCPHLYRCRAAVASSPSIPHSNGLRFPSF